MREVAVSAPIPARVDGFNRVGALFGAMIILLGILDVVSTNLVIAAGGNELNPVVAWFMDSLDHWWHVPKLALHVLAGVLAYHALRSRLAAGCAVVLIIFYCAVVQNNFAQLLAA